MFECATILVVICQTFLTIREVFSRRDFVRRREKLCYVSIAVFTINTPGKRYYLRRPP